MASFFSGQISNLLSAKSWAHGMKSLTDHARLPPKRNEDANWGIKTITKTHSFSILTQQRKFSISAVANSDFTYLKFPMATKVVSCKEDHNQVKCLVRVLHECAKSFTEAVEALQISTELAMAWVGVDVHAWHKNIAHQVAVYALLKSLEMECMDYNSQVNSVLTPKINILKAHIEDLLAMRDYELVRWFQQDELPRLGHYFSPSIKKWLTECVESGVAGITVALSSCAAIEVLGHGYLSTSSFKFWMEDTTADLFNSTQSLVSVGKLHHMAVQAGFEKEFLSHFGAKVTCSTSDSEIEFWVGLALNKLSAAFERESLSRALGKKFIDKVQENSLATLGVFAYLGKRSRVFLSEMGMKDLDDQIKNLLSYMECGGLFMYPELSSLSVYQYFMEVVIDEIGWLDIYASPFSCLEGSQEKRRCKQARQVEKEIGVCNVLTTCSDFFCGFGQFCSSTQQPVDSSLLKFLIRGQELLSVCRRDYWAAYDKSGELHKMAEESLGSQGITCPSLSLDFGSARMDMDTISIIEEKCAAESVAFHQSLLKKIGMEMFSMSGFGSARMDMDTISIIEEKCAAESVAFHQSLLKKFGMEMFSMSCNILVGTHLLCIDIKSSMGLLLKLMLGHTVTEREVVKMKTTLSDIATLIPVTILVLLPLSPVGRAFVFAAIKRYMPALIPSPYRSVRLDVVRQLNRTKKMKRSITETEQAASYN